MKEYIKESAKSAQNSRKEYTIFGHIQVQVTEPLSSGINLRGILKKLESAIPKHLVDDVDSVYIGQYKPLNDRQIDSMYVNGSILISNKQPSEKELYGTFIHEFAHAIEERERDLIYSDGLLSREFLAKRNNLYLLLRDDYELNKKAFLDVNFNQEFDDFIYKTIGYDNLGVITSNLFLSPYACTSLREYFANGFEHYFLKEGEDLKKISPHLYKKIRQVLKTA
jgi:hypothetical protein